jgi:DNA-cytosine methyltransferase
MLIPSKGINVLSLFDGMSCGQIALERAGIKVANYYASEIDKKAIIVTQHNYPNTIQLGDVTQVKAEDLPKIDLLMGGSPCQGFSFSGKDLNFDDPRSKLFFEYVRLLKEIKPKYFLLENVKMKKEYSDKISEFLGVEPVFINSNLFSAQKRKRLYWANFEIPELPEQENPVVLQDILVDNLDSKLYLSEEAIQRGYRKNAAQTIVTTKQTVRIGQVKFPTPLNEKSKCLTAVTVKASRETTHVQDSKGIRILSAIERERLQTVPEGYTSMVSENERCKMLGNGWNVDTIVHILKGLKNAR